MSLVFEGMSLEHTIKFYAVMVSSETEVQRAEAHLHLCDLLGVGYKEFRPFEGKAVDHRVMDEREAERILRKAIRELREKQARQPKSRAEQTSPTAASALPLQKAEAPTGKLEKYCTLCDRTLPDNFGNDPTNRRDGICACGYALWDDNGELRWVGHRTPKPPPLPLRPRVRIVLAMADEKRDGRATAEKRLKVMNGLKAAYPKSIPVEVDLFAPYKGPQIWTRGVVWVPNGEGKAWAKKLTELGAEVERIERMDYDEGGEDDA